MENETLATELLHEIKASAKRWFIAFCIMVGLELATIIGFMWYISLPVEEYGTDVSNEDGKLIYHKIGKSTRLNSSHIATSRMPSSA